MTLPEFKTIKERNKYLVENEKSLVAQKKEVIKYSDGVSVSVARSTNKSVGDTGVLDVTVIINTTNWFDSHKDVHFPSIWKKSLKENKRIIHLQEHRQQFDKVIARGDDLKAYTKTFDWKELGFDYDGKTEALVFESTVRREKNEYMYDSYRKGEVDNHSVGMRYVKLLLAIDDEDYPEHKEIFDTYYPEIANKEEVDGYFWVVKEAKVIEGSAVLLGSNSMTPTISVEAVSDTSKESQKCTRKSLVHLNFY